MWHTSDAAYERLHYHLAGHLATEIEANVRDHERDMFDVIVASSGAYWVMEVSEGWRPAASSVLVELLASVGATP